MTYELVIGGVAAYLLGSIPFGLVLSRLAGYGDIRKIGSGNIGATNVLRTGNKALAALTLLLDAAKGAVAVLILWHWGVEAASVGAIAVFIGHLFPIWLGFRGGKGVATGLGVLLAYLWPVGLLTLATWLIVAFATRYSSLAALIAAILAPVFAWFVAREPLMEGVVIGLALLVVIRHVDNIGRLRRGQESRMRLGGKS